MNESPSTTAVSFVILLLLFFGGGFAGEQLAIALAPGSDVSRFFGFLMLPASFIAGFFFWAGAATFVLIKLFAKGKSDPSHRSRDIPPGASGFVWSSVLFCLLVGALTGLLSREYGFFQVFGAYVATGLAYGISCWQLAKSGWLPFPRE